MDHRNTDHKAHQTHVNHETGAQAALGSSAQPQVTPGPGTTTNVMAILSLIFAFIMAPVGIILGAIALHQIGQTHEEGKGLAVAGLVISIVFTAITILAIIFWIVVSIVLLNSNSHPMHSGMFYSS